MTLTKEQQKLVEDNHNLIYTFLYKSKLDYEQWYDVAAIAMCNAAIKYDGSTKFSTFFFTCATNTVRHCIKAANQKMRSGRVVVSLSDKPYKLNDENNLTVEDSVSGVYNTEKTVTDMIWFEEFIDGANLICLKVLYFRFLGYNYYEIAKKLGCTASYTALKGRECKDKYKSKQVLNYCIDDKDKAECEVYKKKIINLLKKT